MGKVLQFPNKKSKRWLELSVEQKEKHKKYLEDVMKKIFEESKKQPII